MFADIENYIAAGCPTAVPQQVTALIGAAGGTLSLLDGLTLVIPPGALASATTITLRESMLATRR